METPFQPFDPDPEAKAKSHRSFRGVPLRMLVPNMLTLLALCAGLTAIRMAYEGRIEMAILAIAFAAVLDALDGRVARMLKSTSRFGAELDSLSDFVNFGVAPARSAGSRGSSSHCARRSGSPASTPSSTSRRSRPGWAISSSACRRRPARSPCCCRFTCR